MLHCHKVRLLNSQLSAALLDDPDKKKAVTKKIEEKVASMMNVERYMIFNRRTGQVATQMWMEKHVHCVNGKPEFKKDSKKEKPKILTLRIKITGNQVDLALDLGDGHLGIRPVRCWDLRQSESKGDLDFLQLGFGHMGTKHLQEEDDEVDYDDIDFDENEYEDLIPDDAEGLQGGSWLAYLWKRWDKSQII